MSFSSERRFPLMASGSPRLVAIKNLRIWDVNTGKQVVPTLKGHSSGVLAVDFSPDGARVVTGSSDQTAAVWDAVTGERLRTLKGHTGAVRSVAFSADGQQILTSSDDGTAKFGIDAKWRPAPSEWPPRSDPFCQLHFRR